MLYMPSPVLRHRALPLFRILRTRHMIAIIVLKAALAIRLAFINIVRLALARLHAHVVRLGEIHVPDIGAVLLEFADGSLEVAIVADQLAHCVVGLVLGVLGVSGLWRLQVDLGISLAEFAAVVGAGGRRLVWDEVRADTNAGIVVDRPLELEEGVVQFLEVLKIWHECVVKQADQLGLLIVHRQQFQR